MRAVLVLLCALLHPALPSNPCPRECECLPNGGQLAGGQQTITVDCSGRDLLEIPYPLPNGTSHLDVSNNLIQYIREVDFSPGDTALRFLQLQNNDLIDIQSGAFRRLSNLETLNLNNNNRLGVTGDLRDEVFLGLEKLLFLSAFNTGLKRLPSGVFDHLRDVVQIDLRFNQLEEISTGTFSGLRQLQRILLDDNFISNLEEGSFSNLRGLLHLHLTGNQLTAVTERAFIRLSRIKLIDLTDNPLECACCAMYLHSYFSRKMLSSPVCQQPPHLQGANLLDLDIQDLCVEPTALVVPDQPLVLPSGSLLELSCVTSGTPPPQITWSRDGMVLEADGSLVVIMGGSLLISNASQPDSGQYHCSASSSAGLVSSSVQVLVLSEEENVTDALVGQDVVLECSSQVPSGTEVLWSFNASTLAPVSSKYVVLRDGSLLIQEVGLEDRGQYSCQLGQVQLLRTLNLTASPQITFITQGGCAEPSLVIVGSPNTALVCEVFGLPPPSVEWSSTASRKPSLTTIVSAGSVEGSMRGVLMLTQPNNLDEGNYTCVGSNALGTVSQTIRVLVQTTDNSFENILTLQGETIILECPLSEEQLAGEVGVAWFVNSPANMLREGERVEYVCGLNQTVIIREASNPEDVNSYMCAINLLPISSFFSLVLVKPSIERGCATPTTVVRHGENITLSCPARGTPRVRWVWSRAGEVLETGGRVRLLAGGERLSIVPARVEDSGVYNCTVSNTIQGNRFVESFTQRLTVERPPYFTYRPHGITALSGEMGVLFCGGGGSPAPSVHWHRLLPGWVLEEVVSDERVRLADIFLLFTEVRLSDEGTYVCTLTSPLGNRTSSNILLNVYMFPVISVAATQVEVELGAEQVVLECSGSGDPEPELQWLRLPDMSLIPSPGFPNYGSNGSNLVIHEAGLEDAGVYRCWVANVAGQVSEDVTLTVTAPPSPSVEPGEVLANVGCQVTLTCLDAGSPPLDFQWSFNDMPLPLPVETGPQALVRASGELLLSNLRLQDSGNYSCTVSDTFSDATSTSVLTVQDPLFPDPGPPAPPSVSSPTPSSQLLSEGQVAQFVCEVSGVPPPQVLWYQDWQLLTVEESRVQIFSERVLVVYNVSREDDGVYTCLAVNFLGNTSRDFELMVAEPPVILMPPLSQEVSIHSIFNLSCVSSGNPSPVILWLLNDSLVSSDDRRFLDPATGTLDVFNTSVSEDSGFYTCLVWNEVGTAQHTVQVLVTDIRTPLSLRFRPESQTLSSGSPLVLDCIVDGYPPPSLSWSRDGFPLPECALTGPQPHLCVDPLSYIYLPSAQQQDGGVYTCRAERDGEVLLYSADITILPPRSAPVISLAPSSEFVLNGSSFLLDCLASGAPPPQLQWLLNMAPVNLSEDIFQQLENGSLLVLEAGEESVGFFTCVADNGVGRCEVIVQVLLVEEREAAANRTVGLSSPVLTSYPLGSLTLFPGQSATLDCTASGQPPPTITWTRNGLPLTSLTTPTLSLAGNGSLVLSGVTGAEQGNYSCTASNEAGVYSATFELDIAGAVRGFGEQRRVLSGASVELLCVGERRDSHVMWLHGEEQLVVQEDGLVKVKGDGSLQISAAHTAHAGHYMCLSPSNRGWTTSSIQLQVTPREEPPSFSVEPEDMHVVKKGFAVLPCSAHSSTGELTHVHWMWAGSNISRTGQRHAVLQDNSLVLTNVRLQDAGEYSCVASNSYGGSLSTAMVTVSRWKVEEFLFREEGSTVRLTCGLGTGEGVGWLKDGHTPLPTFNGEVWLHGVDHTHQGEYTCSYEKDRLSYFLYVQAAPNITTPPDTMTISPGETATLDCVAMGRPRPQISWHHGGLLLGTDEHLSVLTNGSLVLYEMKAERDAGTYTCRAHNSVGEAALQHVIIVN